MPSSNIRPVAVLILMLLLLTLKSKANDYDFGPNFQLAYAQIQKMQLAKGKASLVALPDKSGSKIYLEDYSDMIYLLVTEDQKFYKTAQSQEEIRLDLLEDLDQNSPYYLFLQAEIRIHWAFVKIKFGHEVAGSWEVIKAYRLLNENAKKFPNFLPTKKSLGLLHVLIGSTPQSFLWVTKILGLDGNIKQGLSEIQEVIKKDSIFDQEAQLIDFLIRSYVTGMTETELNAMKTYIKARPDNQMFYLFGASILIKNNQSQEAWYFLQHQPKGSGYLTAPSFEYLKGEVMIQKGQYAEAIRFYEQYLKMYMGLNFIKDAHYKLYLCHWFLGDRSKDKILINNVLTLGNDVTEQDKVALKFAKNLLTTPPLPQLLKSRMAFDGGYYTQALTELIGLDENTLGPKDQAELNYRKGRIYQKTTDFQKSISFYNKAIVLSKPTHWSFGANACLQLGYIYLSQNQKDKAKNYFQEALNYPKHEYKNSVDNKAQAALNGL